METKVLEQMQTTGTAAPRNPVIRIEYRAGKWFIHARDEEHASWKSEGGAVIFETNKECNVCFSEPIVFGTGSVLVSPEDGAPLDVAVDEEDFRKAPQKSNREHGNEKIEFSTFYWIAECERGKWDPKIVVP